MVQDSEQLLSFRNFHPVVRSGNGIEQDQGGSVNAVGNNLHRIMVQAR